MRTIPLEDVPVAGAVDREVTPTGAVHRRSASALRDELDPALARLVTMPAGVRLELLTVLVALLEQRLRASAPSTVVVVASEAHRRSGGGLDFDDLMLERSYERNLAYSRSKLANILFVRRLAIRLDGTGVRVAAAHPGGVDTPMMSSALAASSMPERFDELRPILITPADAAAGVLRVALDPELADRSGAYFEKGDEVELGPEANDDTVAARLWTVTEQLIVTVSPPDARVPPSE